MQERGRWDGRKALVTGGSGFVGSHVVRGLLNAGCQVAVLARPGSSLSRLDDVRSRVTVLTGDLADPASLLRLDRSWAGDLVVHLGAAGVGHPSAESRTLFDVNVLGTLRILELARQANATRIIYTGSCFEYGFGHEGERAVAPRMPYAVSKAAGGILARTYQELAGVPTVSLRLFTPFGPSEDERRLVAHTIQSALRGQDVTMTGGSQTRDFIYVEDVAEAYVRAAVAPGIDGETIDICTGRETRVLDMVHRILELMGNPVKPCPGAVPHRPHEVWRMLGDPRKARELLGWEAMIPLEEGIRRTIQWFSERRDRRGLEVTVPAG